MLFLELGHIRRKKRRYPTATMEEYRAWAKNALAKRPITDDMIMAFCRMVSQDHSWYKHLRRGSIWFCFFLRELAPNWSKLMYPMQQDDDERQSEIESYRGMYGFLNYVDSPKKNLRPDPDRPTRLHYAHDKQVPLEFLTRHAFQATRSSDVSVAMFDHIKRMVTELSE